jgi:hypothetical protein
MQNVANEKYIARRTLVGRYAGLASLLVVGAAILFPLSWAGSSLLVQGGLLAAAVVGLLLSFIGGYYGERFAGPGAHHKGVRAALKGLDKRYTLFQYVLPVPHVLLGPGGLMVFVVRSQSGKVAYADGRWSHKQRGKFFRELAGQERVGLPKVDVERQVGRMTRYLERRLPGTDVPVQGVLLFTHPDVQLEMKEPPLPVFHGKKVKSWLRGPGAGKTLPGQAQRQLEELFTAG